MRLATLTALIALTLPGLALAEDAAIVVGNERYETAERLRGGTAVVDATAELRAAGIDAQVLRDADRAAVGKALRQLEQQSRRADGLLVALSGRFVFSSAETWFLPIEAEGASLVDTTLGAIPLTTVMTLLSNAPSRAVLLLGTDRDNRDNIGGGLRHGIGRLDIPQGVTVIRAEADVAGDILSGTLARPGASIRERLRNDDGGWVQGYITPDLAFLPGESESIANDPAAREDQDRRLWEQILQRNTEDSYTLYLDAYPDGPFAAEAQRRLAAEIRSEPFRSERAVEVALELDRETRAEIQRDLVLLGHDTRGIDGVFGPGTRGAIKAWQRANEREQSGYLTRAMIQDIDEQARRRATLLDEERRQREAERARAEDAFWSETGQGSSIDGLQRFLERYPDGRYGEQARQRLTELRRERGDSDNDNELRDQLAWEEARKDDTIASYTEYARAYPRGRNADRARARIAELRDAGGGAAQEQARQAEEQLGLNQLTRRAIEQRLAAEGLDTGRADGDFDRKTRDAIRSYQQDAQLPPTGYLNQITVVRLLADSVRRVLQ